MTKRLNWKSDNLETNPSWSDDLQWQPHDKANLVSSLSENGKHRPTLDIDLPCKLVPSKTEGHYHLYIEKDLTHEQYMYLVNALADVGIVGEGIRKQMYVRGMTFLRTNPDDKQYVGGQSPG